MVSEKQDRILRLVIWLLAGTATLASAAAVAQYQIRETAARVEKLETGERDHDIRVQHTEEVITEIRDSLKELKTDVREMRRGR